MCRSSAHVEKEGAKLSAANEGERIQREVILLLLEFVGMLSGVSLLNITVAMWQCFFHGTARSRCERQGAATYSAFRIQLEGIAKHARYH